MGSQAGSDETALGGAGEDLSEGSAGRHPFSGTSVSTVSRRSPPPAMLEELSTVHRYPEWNEAAGRYNKDWTRVEEFVPWDTDNSIDLGRSEEHTSELQSLMRISYAVFCLKKKTNKLTKKQTQ